MTGEVWYKLRGQPMPPRALSYTMDERGEWIDAGIIYHMLMFTNDTNDNELQNWPPTFVGEAGGSASDLMSSHHMMIYGIDREEHCVEIMIKRFRR